MTRSQATRPWPTREKSEREQDPSGARWFVHPGELCQMPRAGEMEGVQTGCMSATGGYGMDKIRGH